MKKLTRILPAACLLALAGLASAAGQQSTTQEITQQESKADRPVHCVDLIRIDHTDILDSKHMLFTMIDKRQYLNTLPVGCPGLRPNDPYLTRTTLTELCDLDIITVLHPTGVGFMQGPSCGLGMFQPVTKNEVDLLKQQIRAKAAKHD